MERSAPPLFLDLRPFTGPRGDLLPELFQTLVAAGARERVFDMEDARLDPFARDLVPSRRAGDPAIDPVAYLLEARNVRRGCERADPLQCIRDPPLHLR